jgi:hypothetical protein
MYLRAPLRTIFTLKNRLPNLLALCRWLWIAVANWKK